MTPPTADDAPTSLRGIVLPDATSDSELVLGRLRGPALLTLIRHRH